MPASKQIFLGSIASALAAIGLSNASAQLNISIGETTYNECVEMCRGSIGNPKCNYARFPVVPGGQTGTCQLLSEKPARHVSSYMVYSMVDGSSLSADDYGSSAAACEAGAEPDLSKVYESTLSPSYGDIHFSEGWYGNKTKTIQVTSKTKDKGIPSIGLSAYYSNEWLVEGVWGRTNGSSEGYFAFYFSTNCSFSGYWWNKGSAAPDVNSDKPNWAGRLKR